jgi:hypothetical protein
MAGAAVNGSPTNPTSSARGAHGEERTKERPVEVAIDHSPHSTVNDPDSYEMSVDDHLYSRVALHIAIIGNV